MIDMQEEPMQVIKYTPFPVTKSTIITFLNYVDTADIPDQLKYIIRYAVMSKLGYKIDRSVKRIIDRLFDRKEFAQYFRRIKFKAITNIYFGNRYVVMAYPSPPYRIYEYTNSRTITGDANFYIVGLMSNNKLFIHKTERHGLIDVEESQLHDTVIAVHHNEDIITQLVKAELGYDSDCEYEECDTSIGFGGRVQGDVVLQEIGTLKPIEHAITDSILPQFTTIVQDYIARQILKIFTNNNITARLTVIEHSPAVTIEIPKTKDTTLGKIINVISNLIVNNLNIGYLFENKLRIQALYIDGAVIDDRVEIYTEWGVKIEVEYRQIYGTSMANIVIRIRVNPMKSPLFKKIIEYAEAKYKEEYGEYEYDYGRHHIKYQGYPNATVITYDDPMLGRLQFNITIPEDTLIVKGQLLMTHPEHQPFFFNFKDVTEIVLRTIRNDAEYRLNLHRLINMAKNGGKK